MVMLKPARALAAALALAGAGLSGPAARAADTIFTMHTAVQSAPAGVTTHDYTDLAFSRPAFAAAAGPHTLIDFNGVDTDPDQYVYYPTGFTLQGATFTPQRGSLYVTDPAWYGAYWWGEGRFLELDVDDPATNSGLRNPLTISFAPTHAFAFEFQYLSYPLNPEGKTFGVTLSTGDAFELATGNAFTRLSGLSFFGVISDQAFSSVTLDLPDFGAYNITDNFRIGAPDPSAAIPEPAAWTLMLMGFAALGAALRRRRAEAAA